MTTLVEALAATTKALNKKYEGQESKWFHLQAGDNVVLYSDIKATDKILDSVFIRSVMFTLTAVIHNTTHGQCSKLF